MGQAPSSQRVTAQDRAILDLKIQRDKLRQYQKKIGTVTQREQEIARECLRRGDKKRALLALRRKKYQESLLEKTDAQLETLEKLTQSIEFSLVQKDVLYGLQQGTAVLKEIHKEMSLEQVEKLMGETADAIAYQEEISDMLGNRISNQDEDEVEDELEAMESDVARTKLPDAPSAELPPSFTVEEEGETAEEKEARLKARAKARARARKEELSRRTAEEPMLA